MKKRSKKKGVAPKPTPELIWQTGEYQRHAEYKFILPPQFLLLCKLVHVTPENLLSDFMDNLDFGFSKREERGKAREHLVNYFLSHGYGREYYPEEDILAIFREMDALASLFPQNGDMKLIEQYAEWRKGHQSYWFDKWVSRQIRK